MKARVTGVTVVLGMVLLVLLTGCGNISPVASFTCTPSSGESPLTVSFNASSSHDSDGTIVTYQWTFGDGSNGTGVTPSHIYTTTSNRTYSITLTVTDDGGAQATDTHVVSVTPPPPNSPPVASFTRTPSSGEAPLNVSFDASASYDSDGSIATYEWAFGDGHSGVGETSTHTFNSAGTYSVQLTVTDNGGARNSTNHSITVTAAPQVEYRVTAEQLLDEYDANEVAADMKYKGKLIAVTGYIQSFDTSLFSDEPIVHLAPSQGFSLMTVYCEFRISQQAQVAQLIKGQLITIVGVCHGELIFSVKLEECHIE